MADFIFHSESLSERGTETSAYFLGVELMKQKHNVSFAYNARSSYNHEGAVGVFGKIFELIPYKDISGVRKHISQNYDISYLIKNRGEPIIFRGLFNAAHVIFDEFEPYGNSYNYISRSLANYSRSSISRATRLINAGRGLVKGCRNAMSFDFINYIVNMPECENSVNKHALGIPDEAFVLIRMGGKTTFDIPWVKRTLIRFLEENNDTWFVAINTDKFSDHKRIIYLDTIVDLQTKADILALGDLFLHGRIVGETFGMSIIESLQMGTPVIAWSGGRDQEHVSHLARYGWIYHDSFDLWNLLVDFKAQCSQPTETVLLQKDYPNSFRPDVLLPIYHKQMFNLLSPS